MKKISLLAGTIMLTGLISCTSGESDGNTPYKPISLTQSQTRACEKNNDFALSYLRETDGGNGNTVVSPFTVFGVLGMLANGAAEDTQREIVEAIGLDDINALNSYYLTLSSTLPAADSKTDLYMASSIWLKSDFQVKAEYMQTLEAFYGTERYTLEEDPSQSLKKINSWVSEKTKGKIPNFLNFLDVNTKTGIFSATYFKGKWKKKFKKEDTAPGDFHNEDGSFMKKTDMMVKEESVAWYHHDSWDAIDIPYGNGSFRMTVVLPSEGSSVRECLDILSHRDLSVSSACYLRTTEMEIKLPRFTIEPETKDIKDVLGKMGIRLAFQAGKANFSGMTDSDLYFDRFIQSTTIRVDEEGSVATSAAGATGGFTSPGPAEGKFHVDRPFIFLIREKSTGAILFAGTVRNPEYR